MKRKLRTAGIIMLMAAAVFVAYAVTHPESTWPWPNILTYLFYDAYLMTAVGLIIGSFFTEGGSGKGADGNA